MEEWKELLIGFIQRTDRNFEKIDGKFQEVDKRLERQDQEMKEINFYSKKS